MKIPKITCALPCKTAVVLALAIIYVGLSGCAGYVKKYDEETGEKIESIPAGVAVLETSAARHAECEDEVNPMAAFAASNCNDPNLKEDGQTACYQTKQLALFAVALGVKQGGDSCHQQVAEETKAFFAAQSAKYRQWGTVGKAGVIGGFTYLGAKSLFDAFAAASSAGDVSIGTLNATKSDDPYGIGGEGGGGTGGDVSGDQIINIGSGKVASGRGQLNDSVDKAINTPLDGDSNFDGNGNPTGITIDDAYDGSGNTLDGLL